MGESHKLLDSPAVMTMVALPILLIGGVIGVLLLVAVVVAIVYAAREERREK